MADCDAWSCGSESSRLGCRPGADPQGFTAAEVLALIPKAVEIFPAQTASSSGFPVRDDVRFQPDAVQMVSFRMMGARILPACFRSCRRRR